MGKENGRRTVKERRQQEEVEGRERVRERNSPFPA